MSLLQLVHSQIGFVHRWPRLILKYLFCEPANPLSTLAIINFLYGNGVPCEMAVQLFRACNEAATDELINHFDYYYKTYQNSKDVSHPDIYFNLKVEKHVYISGSRSNQLEIVDFLDTNDPKVIGFGNLYTKSIRKKIRRIHENGSYQ